MLNSITYFCFVLMGATFYLFALLDKYRLDRSQYWTKKSDLGTLNNTDVASISQMQSYSSILELIFLILYLVIIVIAVYSIKNSRMSPKTVISINVLFWALFFISSLVFSVLYKHPLANILQISYSSISVIILLAIFMIFSRIKNVLYGMIKTQSTSRPYKRF